jgi:hypothetical protein
MEPPSKKLLDQIRNAIHLKPYFDCTAETSLQWIRHYILFHNKRQQKAMGVPEIDHFWLI